MKKFELTKEQLTYLHSVDAVKYIIEEWFPNEFPKLEVGDWVKTCDGGYFKITSREGAFKGYGVIRDKSQWHDSWEIDYNSIYGESLVKLTTQEVEEALTKEAVKRYKIKTGIPLRFEFNGVKYSSTYCEDLDCFKYKNNELFFNGGILMQNGIWAEIVSEPIELTLDQVAEKFGYDVKQIKIMK